MADFDCGAKQAIALAPAEALVETKGSVSIGTAETEVLEATLAAKTSKVAETCTQRRHLKETQTNWPSTSGLAIAVIPIGQA